MRFLSRISESASGLRSFRRLFGFLCAPALAASLAVVDAPTQVPSPQLISVSGEYGAPATLQRFNITAQGATPLLSTVTLSGIPTGHRIRGITPFNGTETSSDEGVVYSETADGRSHLWLVNVVNGTALSLYSPMVWDEQKEEIRPEDMVGMARTPLGTLPSLLAQQGWHALLGASGMCFGPPLDGESSGPTSTGVTGSLPFPGPYLGGTQHNQSLLVAAQAENPQLFRLAPIDSLSPLTPGPAPLSVLQSWTVPFTGQLLGWTISSNGVFYAMVNRFVPSGNRTTGYVELVRSTVAIDLAGPTLTLQSVGSHLHDWDNDTNGPLMFPRVNLTFPSN